MEVWKFNPFAPSLMKRMQASRELASIDAHFIVVSQGLDTDQANRTLGYCSMFWQP